MLKVRWTVIDLLQIFQSVCASIVKKCITGQYLWRLWQKHGNSLVTHGVFPRVGHTFSTVVRADELSKCYQVNSKNYCFYTNRSVLSWDEAREFCARLNSTLPIITDEDVDNVFQQFLDSNSLFREQPVWIAAHARPVNNSVKWHWIDGQTSGTDSTAVM